MRELLFAVAVAVLAEVAQSALTGLWHHVMCVAHVFCA
jgi:hypothetical protein